MPDSNSSRARSHAASTSASTSGGGLGGQVVGGEAGHRESFLQEVRRTLHHSHRRPRGTPHGVRTPMRYRPAGWRATKPPVGRMSFCQREPVTFAPDVSKRMPATTIQTWPWLA